MTKPTAKKDAATIEALKAHALENFEDGLPPRTPARERTGQSCSAVMPPGERNWIASDQPAWLTEEAYLEKIQPLLAGIPNSAITKALWVSLPYAVDIRHGKRIPHPRHWVKLAELVGVSS